jgi:hypothetical protein
VSKRIQGQSTRELKRKVKIAKVILIVCWSAIVVAVIVTLLCGKSPFIPGFIAGTLGLVVISIAMWAGAKKINEVIARRSD